MTTKTEAGERDYSVLYLRHGIPEAFKVFFFEYYSELFSFSQMLLQHRAAASRMTMEAFFQLWDKRADFDSAKTIKAFLYLVVRNKCIQQLKAPATGGERASVADTVPASLPPELLRELLAFAARTA
jgi:DNA-directed RNA polymerase specialized sigma24 family protein